MRLGVIYCCYGNPEYIDDCLAPWLEAKKSHDILIAATHGQFKEYYDLRIEDKDLSTLLTLKGRLEAKTLDYLYIQNDYLENKDKIYQTESEIRDKGLQWLLKQKCDYVCLLDNDERYTSGEINNIIKYIQTGDNILYDWFSINFKNIVFDGKKWVDGFCPPRFFKVKTNNYILDKCVWDNDFQYKGVITRDFKDYKQLSRKEIPRKIAQVKHLTWLHSNGKQKIEYQNKHFNGNCSYKWNEQKQELEFNLDYYAKNNIPLPTLNDL